jgi:5'(3')-deoxyribonucleotidase
MKRESIAFDVDDVLASHVESFIVFSNKHYGTSLTMEDYSDHWADFWDIDEDEIDKRALEFQTPKRIASFAVKNDAKSALMQLKTKYDLFIVTARREHIVDTSTDWISRHFPDVFKGTHFVPIWVPNNKITKGDICKKIGADYLVDDLPRHCNIAAEAGIKVVLFGDYAWNRDEKIINGVTRCKNWDEVLGYFGADNA